MAQTQLDPGQVVKHVYDEVNEAIKVNLVAGAGAGGASQTDESAFVEGSGGVNPIGGVYNDSIGSPSSGEVGAARITPARALHTNLRDNNGTEVGITAHPLRTDPTGTTPQPASQSGTWNINNVSGTVSLPTGAATESTLSSLNGKVTTVNTGAVVVASSALPSGASTSALQTSGNASLTSIDGKTPALGQALAASSVPVVLTAAQLSTLTPLSTVVVTQPTGSNLHVSVDSSVLPTGAATSSNQVAQTNDLDFIVVSSQQTANNTASLNLVAGTTTTGQTGPMVLGSVTTAAPTYSTGQLNPFNMTTSGRLRIDGSGTTQPISAASLPLPTGAATESTIAARLAGSLVPTAFDYIAVTYVSSGNGIGQIATASYKTGGSGGTLVKTLTLAYDVNNKISSVTAT